MSAAEANIKIGVTAHKRDNSPRHWMVAIRVDILLMVPENSRRISLRYEDGVLRLICGPSGNKIRLRDGYSFGWVEISRRHANVMPATPHSIESVFVRGTWEPNSLTLVAKNVPDFVRDAVPVVPAAEISAPKPATRRQPRSMKWSDSKVKALAAEIRDCLASRPDIHLTIERDADDPVSVKKIVVVDL